LWCLYDHSLGASHLGLCRQAANVPAGHVVILPATARATVFGNAYAYCTRRANVPVGHVVTSVASTRNRCAHYSAPGWTPGLARTALGRADSTPPAGPQAALGHAGRMAFIWRHIRAGSAAKRLPWY